MSTFAIDVQRWCDKEKVSVDNAVRKILFDFSTSLVNMSPVGRKEAWAVNVDRAARGLDPVPPGYVGGRFRANWQYGEGTKPTGALYGEDDSSFEDASSVIARLHSMIGSAKMVGTVHYLTNNLPYSVRLENGWSKTQAPEGIVAITAMNFTKFYNEAIRA